MSIEKGPISASVVLYFQHDDAARKLVFVYLFIYLFYGSGGRDQCTMTVTVLTCSI